MGDPADRDMTGSQSVDRAAKLLSLVGRQLDGMSLSAVVEKSGLNKPTVRRLLLALIRAGLLEQDDRDRRYYIGEEAYVLGTLASTRHGLLRLATESLHRLAQKTSDSCFLSVRRGASSVCLHREEGSFPIRTHALQAGFVHPLGVGAGSLAMLAALPDEEVSSVLEQNAAVLEEQFPMLAPDELRRRVELTRAQGHAVNPGLSSPTPGVWASQSAIPTAASPGPSALPPSTAACRSRGRASWQLFSGRKRHASKASSPSSSATAGRDT